MIGTPKEDNKMTTLAERFKVPPAPKQRKPYGKGARTSPTKWKAVDRVEFARRRIAKARAYSRYLKSKQPAEVETT